MTSDDAVTGILPVSFRERLSLTGRAIGGIPQSLLIRLDSRKIDGS